MRRAESVAEQLQGALNSRVAIDQAKGRIAYKANIAPDDALTVLRRHARANGLRLTDLCRDVLDERIDLTATLRPAR